MIFDWFDLCRPKVLPTFKCLTCFIISVGSVTAWKTDNGLYEVGLELVPLCADLVQKGLQLEDSACRLLGSAL